MRIRTYFLLIATFASPLIAQESTTDDLQWISFPDTRLVVNGLPWFEENKPDLSRFPKIALDERRTGGVHSSGRMPNGARIRLTSNTSQLSIRVQIVGKMIRGGALSAFGSRGLDCYVDGQNWRSVLPTDELKDLTFFEDAGNESKEITIYLPITQQIRIEAIGIDKNAGIETPPPFSLAKPVVFYGSSICQGIGASRPAMTYEAILSRKLNLDYVNLGFAGAGKAEPEVVDLIKQIDASCFVFDLAYSFRNQSPEVYGAMIDAIRKAHPNVPLICITPIFFTAEAYDKGLRDRKKRVRNMMQDPVRARMSSDPNLYLVEGVDLLGAAEADAYHDGAHPTDLGYQIIANRLAPSLEKALSR
jgi:lysophospholipase L1-like esterase